MIIKLHLLFDFVSFTSLKLSFACQNLNNIKAKLLFYINRFFPNFAIAISIPIVIVKTLLTFKFLTEMMIRNNKEKIIKSKGRFGCWTFNNNLCSMYIRLMAYANPTILGWLGHCGKLLEKELEKNSLERPILCPLHVFSDEFAIIISGMSTKKTLYVISDVEDEDWKNKWGEGIQKFREENINNIVLFNPFVCTKANASQGIMKIIKGVRAGHCDFAIFSDAIPEHTSRLSGSSHSYKTVDMFERKALLHAGSFNFPRVMKKKVLPFYVYVEKFKLRISILPVIDNEDVEKKLPLVIEDTIRKKQNQWILWHFPSFFYFNG